MTSGGGEGGSDEYARFMRGCWGDKEYKTVIKGKEEKGAW